MKKRTQLSNIVVLAAALVLQSCGGGGGTTVPAQLPATYSIGGIVSGLSGTGLVLQNNGVNDLGVASSGTFTFSAKLSTNAAYSVSVKIHPTARTQTCAVSSGTGTVVIANVTSVLVSCVTRTYSVGGTVSGLLGTGLTLLNNGGNSLAIASSGTFTFSTWIAEGDPYSVIAGTQPTAPAQTCLVTSGSGTMAAAPVTNVAVACPALANGSACTNNGNCTSGNCECADALCVTKVCSAVNCLCGYSTTGASCNGNLTMYTDPKNNDCAPYVCNGSGACFASCTSSIDCDLNNMCSGGVCGAKQALGAVCGTNGECGSTFCSWGVCCERDCSWGTGCSMGLCTGSVKSASCTTNSQCASNFCAPDNQCCEVTCASGTCSNGECTGLSAGGLCTEPAQCTSGNCSIGVCQ